MTWVFNSFIKYQEKVTTVWIFHCVIYNTLTVSLHGAYIKLNFINSIDLGSCHINEVKTSLGIFDFLILW